MSSDTPDDFASYDRRESDRKLDSFLTEVREMILTAVREHVQGHHAGLTKEQIQERLDMQMRHDEAIPKILDALDGTDIVDENGFVVGREPGIVELTKNNAKVLDVLDHRTNGGVTITYKPEPEKRRIWFDWTTGERIAAVSVGVVVLGPNLMEWAQAIATWFGSL